VPTLILFKLLFIYYLCYIENNSDGEQRKVKRRRKEKVGVANVPVSLSVPVPVPVPVSVPVPVPVRGLADETGCKVFASVAAQKTRSYHKGIPSAMAGAGAKREGQGETIGKAGGGGKKSVPRSAGRGVLEWVSGRLRFTPRMVGCFLTAAIALLLFLISSFIYV
jgi:hypothetical protein